MIRNVVWTSSTRLAKVGTLRLVYARLTRICRAVSCSDWAVGSVSLFITFSTCLVPTEIFYLDKAKPLFSCIPLPRGPRLSALSYLSNWCLAYTTIATSSFLLPTRSIRIICERFQRRKERNLRGAWVVSISRRPLKKRPACEGYSSTLSGYLEG